MRSSTMPLTRYSMLLAGALCTALAGGAIAFADAQTAHDPSMHHHMGAMGDDPRQLVDFPPPMRQHTLANMRDHLLTISEIQAALSAGQFDRASTLAEQRLGMTSLKLHGAHELSQYMPPGMRELGTTMHRSASAFALEAQAAGVSGDVRPALRALSKVTQSCVACHAAYRLH
ncbi:MAG TPA: hypothetical protein VKA50_04075 [Gammaproteobacteria bacterium]|nr:hypothetical protein [Gammaproteobacteria bacterium]